MVVNLYDYIISIMVLGVILIIFNIFYIIAITNDPEERKNNIIIYGKVAIPFYIGCGLCTISLILKLTK